MATTLEVKLQTALQAYTAITSLLATRSDGKAAIYDMQENPGSALPAMALFVVSAVDQYSTTQLLITALYRVQFTIWANDPEVARSVERALRAFVSTFNAYNSGDNNPRQRNWCVNRHQSGQAQTQPITWWRIIDAFFWNNETI
jgi:hypothetical protein